MPSLNHENAARLRGRAIEDLASLVAIPSVSSLPEHAADMTASASAVARLLTEAGCPEVRVVRADGHPAVIGRYPAPPGAPTIGLYAHHDVQPAGDPSRWFHGEPFRAVERDGRLYGRGAGDDKAGIVAHLLALRLLDGRPPVGVTVFVEGEEEIGSPSLPALLAEHREVLAADAYVIADATNWGVGVPAFTTTLRGIAELIVTVSVTDRPLHSGIFGGVVPDALTSLCVLVATLFDADGNITVDGLDGFPGPELEYPEDRLRRETGLLDGVRQVGSGPIAERLWTKPALAVVAIDAPPVAAASNTLYPSARAKLSLRVPPGADATAYQTLVRDHLVAHAPFGAHVHITYGEVGEPFRATLEGPVRDAAMAAFTEAWGVAPVEQGGGGSLPLAAVFAEAFPGRPLLISAVLDPTSAMHAPDESVSVDDVLRCGLAEALFLTKVAHVS